jgi:hypothetical protein
MSRLLIIVCLFLIGCGQRTSVTIPAKSDPKDTMPATERVRRAVPVLNRTLTQNDLNQLRTFMENARAEKGSYPKSLADMPDLARDAPKLANAVYTGELVISGGTNGVLAYEAAAIQERGSVVTSDGVQMMTADELKQKLGQSR